MAESRGRKSYKDEIKVVQYMTELAPSTFKFVKECLASKNKADRKWATEQMMKLYSKAIPEQGDDPDNPIFISGINYVIPNATNPLTDNPTTDIQTAPSIPSA